MTWTLSEVITVIFIAAIVIVYAIYGDWKNGNYE